MGKVENPQLTVNESVINEIVRMLDPFTEDNRKPNAVSMTVCRVRMAEKCPFQESPYPACGSCGHFDYTAKFIAARSREKSGMGGVARRRTDLIKRPGGAYTIETRVNTVNIFQGDPGQRDAGSFRAELIRKKPVDPGKEFTESKKRGRLKKADKELQEKADKTAAQHQLPYTALRRHGQRGGRTVARGDEIDRIIGGINSPEPAAENKAEKALKHQKPGKRQPRDRTDVPGFLQGKLDKLLRKKKGE